MLFSFQQYINNRATLIMPDHQLPSQPQTILQSHLQSVHLGFCRIRTINLFDKISNICFDYLERFHKLELEIKKSRIWIYSHLG